MFLMDLKPRHVRGFNLCPSSTSIGDLETAHANVIVGPNETITSERVRDWCAKHRHSFKTQR
jgi:hypothetical protein